MKALRVMQLYNRYLWIIILFLVACTSSQKEDTPKDEEPYPSAEDIPTTSKQNDDPKVHIVEIKQMKFQPAEIKVHKGETVLWINKDITDHDVTEESTKAWASSPLAAGKSWSMVVTQSADYYCNLHQVMKGKIVVE
jgi:plastocyanin